MTHDYKRNGTTTLFAALDVLDGPVIGRCMQRHRHQEFIRFLNAIERAARFSSSRASPSGAIRIGWCGASMYVLAEQSCSCRPWTPPNHEPCNSRDDADQQQSVVEVAGAETAPLVHAIICQ